MAAVIEAQGLSKIHGSLTVLDGISFQVEEGEFFRFLEGNGAGKTRTICVFAGLVRSGAGKDRMLDFNISKEVSRTRHYIEVVSELPNVYNELTVLENILFMGSLYGILRQEQRKREIEALMLFHL